jgi:uncharacterized protein YdeI (YjbR/CyaY-like superfamily)
VPTKDPRIDAYIERAADFAKPILKRIRRLVHTGCPDVEETVKWQHPTFVYKGILCGMAAFKQHCALGFWKGKLLFKDDKADRSAQEQAMGQFGRITSLSDLPADSLLLRYVREAARLNEEGVKIPSGSKARVKQELAVPGYLVAALKKNTRALETFERFSPSHKREYVEWLTEAKRDETRDKRLETAIVWMAEGKPRNWKYMNCGSAAEVRKRQEP